MNAAKWYMRQVPFFKKWLNISSMPGQFYILNLQHAKYNVHSMGVSGIQIFLPLKTIDRFESIQALIGSHTNQTKILARGFLYHKIRKNKSVLPGLIGRFQVISWG
jgi:hypothetical protein